MINFLGLFSMFDSVTSSDIIADLFDKLLTNWIQKQCPYNSMFCVVAYLV